MMVCDKGRFLSLLLVAAFGVVAGCSGAGDNKPREAVSGAVTLDGQALASGTITFNPTGAARDAEGMGGGGVTISNGRFSLGRDVGLLPGSYNVAIYASDKPADRTKPAQVGNLKSAELAKELIPAKYNSKSELKADIKKGGGNDALKFDLQSK
jgi:hypothetical protein